MLTKPQVFYDNNLKQALAFQNSFYVKKAQHIRSMLFEGTVIAKKTNVISIADSKETLMLEEEIRSKMLLKQNFGKCFVPQQELSAEQAFWFQMSNPSTESSDASPVKVDVPSELPKVSLVNASLKTLKFHLAKFDSVVRTKITPSTLTEDLLNEITEVQTIFDQMKAAVQQYSVDKRCLEIAKNQALNENYRLLEQIISQDIVNIVVNSLVDINDSVNANVNVNSMEMCNKCLKLKAELIKQHNVIKKDEYNNLLKIFEKLAQLEQHYVSLELAMQLNKEIFQKNNTSANQTELTFDQLFKVNNLKAQLQAKNMTIKNGHISWQNYFRRDEHLKQTYKQLYDLIKPSCVHAKEHRNAFVKTTLKNDLRKLKGKDIVDNAAQVSNTTTITLGMYKLDPLTLAPKDKNNRETHIFYLKYTMEQAAILREIVKQVKSLNPLDSASYSTCKYVKLLQELLGYVRDTCPDIHKTSKKLVVVTPINKKKTVRIIATNKVPLREPIPLEVAAQEPVVTKVYTRRPKVVQIVLWYLDSGCSKHMTGDRSQLTNFIYKFLGTIKFGNDQVAKIMGYRDYQIGNVIISRVYYVEGLGHNLFFVGQFCDSDLKVAFRKHACFVRNLEGVDLLSGSRGTNFYSLSIRDMMASSPICLLQGLVRGLPRLKFEKDHFCSACALGKSKKQSHKLKSKDTNQEKLYLLHMDLYGPMRVASIMELISLIKLCETTKKRLASLMKHRLRELHNKMVLLKGEILLHDRKPDLSYLHVFGALCSPNNDSANLGKLQAKADIGVFIGYEPKKKAYRIYNRRTRRIIETIYVDFDKLMAMASEQSSLELALREMTLVTPGSGLVPNPPPLTLFVPPSRHEWDLVFQPVFDEFFSPPDSVVSPVPEVGALAPVKSTDSPSLT
ncbi:retrovirus-related pol polyprotein from transposon TNT 1-94, partial [Tanacetum coccineum]